MESAFESDNDQLVIEMIKHYQYLPGWNSVDICDARNENIEIIQMLVDSGVNVDHYYHGGNAAFSASETVLAAFAEAADDPAILQLLIDHGSQINTEAYDPGGGFNQLSSVFNAARVGKAGNLRVLMENGGDIHRGQFFLVKPRLWQQ